MQQIDITHTLSFKTKELQGYFVGFTNQHLEVTVCVEGIYTPAHFVGEFEGYKNSSFQITHIYFQGKQVTPSKKLLSFLTDRFMEALSPAYEIYNDEC